MAQRKDPIKNVKNPANLAFVTFDPSKPSEAANALENSKALEKYQAVAYYGGDGGGGMRDRYEDISTNISVRNEFTRKDYDAFRPNEARAIKAQDIMRSCDAAYKRVGIVRNVIDLMSDFGSQGVKLVHPNKRVQRFAQRWFSHKIHGENITERFLNYLYRIGSVVAQRQMSKISMKEERILSIAGNDSLVLEPTHDPKEPLKTKKRVIPSGYTFLNPLTVEIVGGELAQFAGQQSFGLKISGNLRTKIMSPKNEMEKELIDKLPKELVEAVKKGTKILPLDNSKIVNYSYKKDDWDVWASPMLECVLDDLVLLEKMKLADLAALDGAISQIRIWRLGDLDKGILPTDAAIQKLADILLSNPGGGAFDLIWGPELSFEEVTTSVHNFLGGTKYEPILDAIHGGLGVPPTLTGSSNAGGATNNFVSLQTLVQRLEYGRQQVTKFWEQELELLRQAMGWSKAPTVQFDNMILKDEAAEKALLIQLLDRNLVSEEMVIELFGGIPSLEESRKKRERKDVESGKRAPKVGPYSEDKIHELIKVALTRGYITPDQAGLELEDPEAETPFDKQIKMRSMGPPGGGGGPGSTNKGKSGQGRPKTSTDKPGTNRNRQFKPRTSAEIASDIGGFLNGLARAKKTQNSIGEVLAPGILTHYNKKNMRSLSADEANASEYTKFKILCNLPKNTPVNEESVAKVISKNPEIPSLFKMCYDTLVASHIQNVGRQPTIEEIRNIQAATYSLCTEIR